jgi:hypothetical protein
VVGSGAPPCWASYKSVNQPRSTKGNNVTIRKYRTSPGCGIDAKPRIEEIAVDEDSREYVVIKGFRYEKSPTSGYCYFDSWENAKAYLIDVFSKRVCDKEQSLSAEVALYNFVFRMEKPNATANREPENDR